MVEFSCENVQSWTFAYWNFLITNSISLLVIGLFRLSISSSFSLGRLYVSRNIFISLGCPIFWYLTLHNVLLWFFVFLCIGCYFSSFISNSVYLGPLSFSLGEFIYRLTKVFYLSKNQLLVSLIFSSFLFSISSLIFIIPFLLLTLCFVGSHFLYFFRC